MAKIAELHNGVQIHFPDDTPEDQMDLMVRRHLGIETPKTDVMEPLLKAITAHVSALNSVSKNPTDAAMKALLSAIGAHIEALSTPNPSADKMHGESMQTIQGIGTTIAEQIAGLNHAVSTSAIDVDALIKAIMELSKNTPKLIAAVHGVSATLVETTKILNETLRSPRVLEKEADGSPKAVVIK